MIVVVAGGSAFAGRGSAAKRPYAVLLSGQGHGPLVKPTMPETPGVPTDHGSKSGTSRTFQLTASEFTQKIANFPLSRVNVWGYNHSAPGPTLIAYQGERIRIVLHNELPVPTTLHPHGLDQPNSQDGVSGISQPTPIPPGGSHIYTFVPGPHGNVQALAMLDAGMGVMDARVRVQAALRAKNRADVRMGRLRTADAALGRGDVAGARRELEAAFNPDDRHLIGTSFSGGNRARVAAAILGAIAAAAALALLLRQRSRADR